MIKYAWIVQASDDRGVTWLNFTVWYKRAAALADVPRWKRRGRKVRIRRINL